MAKQATDDSVQLNDRAKSAFGIQEYGGGGGIDGVDVVALQRFNDDGGSITELGRLTSGQHAQMVGFEVKQINYSEVDPGVIKAYHMHRRQTDVWYVPPSDKVLLVLHDFRSGSPTEGGTMRFVLGDGNSSLVRIPPGVAHGCRNIGPAVSRIVYLVDIHFTTDADCDEGRLPWDHLGAEIWEITKG